MKVFERGCTQARKENLMVFSAEDKFKLLESGEREDRKANFVIEKASRKTDLIWRNRLAEAASLDTPQRARTLRTKAQKEETLQEIGFWGPGKASKLGQTGKLDLKEEFSVLLGPPPFKSSSI